MGAAPNMGCKLILVFGGTAPHQGLGNKTSDPFRISVSLGGGGWLEWSQRNQAWFSFLSHLVPRGHENL